MKVNLNNSIYQQKGSGYNGSNGSGLTVSDGMLINNRPDGETGIAHMARAKKEMKRMKKIDMISEGVAIGNAKTNTRNDFFMF
tara:strand:+ start:82 stop:330 length:249 start_codon:yes stop_codon:yes gene_type:complete